MTTDSDPEHGGDDIRHEAIVCLRLKTTVAVTCWNTFKPSRTWCRRGGSPPTSTP